MGEPLLLHPVQGTDPSQTQEHGVCEALLGEVPVSSFPRGFTFPLPTHLSFYNKTHHTQHKILLNPLKASLSLGFLPEFAPYVAAEVANSSRLGTRLKVPQL